MQPQVKKFDHTKPYGSVFGHPEASFVQDGVMYTGAGDPISGDIEAEKVVEKVAKAESGEVAFLNDLLKGGPMLRSSVKKESEKFDLVWSKVDAAAAKMKMQKLGKGPMIMWKLAGDQ